MPRWILESGTGNLIPEEEWNKKYKPKDALMIIPDTPAGHTEHLGDEVKSWTGRRSKKLLMKAAGVIQWEPGLQKKRSKPVNDPNVQATVRGRVSPKQRHARLEKLWRDYHRG